MLAGVSRDGLTLMSSDTTFLRVDLGSRSIARAITLVTTGHCSLHLESTQESTTTRPRSRLIVTLLPR